MARSPRGRDCRPRRDHVEQDAHVAPKPRSRSHERPELCGDAQGEAVGQRTPTPARPHRRTECADGRSDSSSPISRHSATASGRRPKKPSGRSRAGVLERLAAQLPAETVPGLEHDHCGRPGPGPAAPPLSSTPPPARRCPADHRHGRTVRRSPAPQRRSRGCTRPGGRHHHLGEDVEELGVGVERGRAHQRDTSLSATPFASMSTSKSTSRWSETKPTGQTTTAPIPRRERLDDLQDVRSDPGLGGAPGALPRHPPVSMPASAAMSSAEWTIWSGYGRRWCGRARAGVGVNSTRRAPRRRGRRSRRRGPAPPGVRRSRGRRTTARRGGTRRRREGLSGAPQILARPHGRAVWGEDHADHRAHAVGEEGRRTLLDGGLGVLRAIAHDEAAGVRGSRRPPGRRPVGGALGSGEIPPIAS